jgi:hypothetical protein
MNLIKNSPFHVLGITINASERDIQKQTTKAKRFLEVGKDISYDTDYEFLGEVKRDANTISKASSDIEQPENKLLHSLFWYWEGNHIDSAAFESLKNNNTEKAIEIWSKVVKDGNVSTKNYSCLSNLKSLYLGLAFTKGQVNLELFIKGLQLTALLFKNQDLNIFVKTVVGNHFKISNEDLELKFTNQFYNEIQPFLGKKNGLSLDRLISSFETFSDGSRQFIANKFTADPTKKIEDQINTSSELREKYVLEAIGFADSLYENTKSSLESLKKILGTSDVKYVMLADKLANEILQCGIDYFNKVREEGNESNKDGEELLSLCKLAKGLINESQSQVNTRIDETIAYVEDWLNDESRELISKLNEAYEVLNEWDLAEAYTRPYKGPPMRQFWYKPSLVSPAEDLVKNAKKALPKLKKTLDPSEFLKISDQIVQIVIALAIKHVNEYNQKSIACCYLFHDTRNFAMSPEVKKRHTENHNILYHDIMWSAGGGVLSGARKQERNTRLRALFNSHEGLMTDSYRWETIEALIETADDMSDLGGPSYAQNSTNSNSRGGCYIATMVYGDYEHPQVMVLRSFRDEFLSRFLLGKYFIKFYYKYSPSWVESLKNKRLINKIIKKSLNQVIRLIE